MRIELGPGGKIVGTRRVSPNGQVSGLRDFAGKEVLVILPGEPGREFASPQDYLKDVQEAVQDQVKRSLESYLALQRLLINPTESDGAPPSEGKPRNRPEARR